MITLDTNVLVRIFVEPTEEDDTRRQRERARAFVLGAAARGEQFFVPDVVVCESVWVMRSQFGKRRGDLLAYLHDLLHAAGLTFEDLERLARAYDAFARGKGDFADYLIRERGREAGCRDVLTFDQALLREDGFVAP